MRSGFPGRCGGCGRSSRSRTARRRQRSESDKRRVNLSVTPAGRKLLREAPQPLQEGFITRFNQLQDWEQHLIVSSLARIAAMMDAEGLDAAPLLAPGEEVH